MLYYTPQIWCSDNTDPIDRLEIQYGTSFIYPVSSVGSHVSASPNHQTGRVTSLKTRAVAATPGTFGYELDLNKLSSGEKEEIRGQIKEYKKYARLVQQGAVLPPDRSADSGHRGMGICLRRRKRSARPGGDDPAACQYGCVLYQTQGAWRKIPYTARRTRRQDIQQHSAHGSRDPGPGRAGRIQGVPVAFRTGRAGGVRLWQRERETEKGIQRQESRARQRSGRIAVHSAPARPEAAGRRAAEEDRVFAERLSRHHDELRWLYMELYWKF